MYPTHSIAESSTEHDQYRQLLDTAMFPVVVTAFEDHSVLYINTSAGRFFGVDPKAATGQRATDYWQVPEQRAQYIEQLLKYGNVRDYETHLKSGDRQIRLVRVSGNIITFDGQEAISSVFEDITEQRSAESKLRAGEERYHQLYNLMRLLSDTMPDLIWAKDLDGNFLFSNKANSERLLKSYDLSEPIGRDHHFFAERERENGHRYTFGEICANSDEIVRRTRKAGKFIEEGYVRDEYIKLDVHKVPLLDTNGEMIGTVGAGRDITTEDRHRREKEASEQRYKLLAENVRDVIWTMDKELHFTYFSPSLKNILGYTPEDYIHLDMFRQLPRKTRNLYRRMRKHYRDLLKSGKLPDEQEIWIAEHEHQNGSRTWIETITSPILDENNIFLGIVGVTRDATPRIEAQKELNKAKDDALAASRAKSEFLANMSHEIRTPMNGILGMLQLLKNSQLSTDQNSYVNTAMESGSSLLRLISDILDFSKIEAGKFELSRDLFQLDALLANVMHSFETQVDNKTIELSMDLADSVPLHIFADKFRLQQVLFNLLGNSVKFTEAGSILLRVDSGPVEEEKSLIVFTLEDTGIGIPEDRMKDLFEPFVQADGSFRRRYSGTGLGLSIVRQLVTMMGGTINLHSVVGQGTTITFSIPVDICLDCVRGTNNEKAKDCKKMRSAKILVVEDEKINAMVISAMLKNMGHEATVAENGKEALNRLQEHSFDCILMDIQMPEMDGLETARTIRKLAVPGMFTPPIIAVTAHAMKGDRETFLAAGMDEYITKPVDGAELEATLRRLFR